MIALIDENISWRVASASRELGLQAVHVTDKDGPGKGTPDLTIFQWLQNRGKDWVFLTQDIAQTRKLSEYQQMRSLGLGVFVVQVKRPPSVIDLGAVIVGRWTEMAVVAETTLRPFVYSLRPFNKSLRPLL